MTKIQGTYQFDNYRCLTSYGLFLVLVELLEQLVEVHSNNAEEAIFPLIDFSGTVNVNYLQLQPKSYSFIIMHSNSLPNCQNFTANSQCRSRSGYL